MLMPPIPKPEHYEIKTHDAQVLILLYTCKHHETSVENLTPVGKEMMDMYASLAAWSWYTWHEYSDARQLGVPVSIYMEDVLEDDYADFFVNQGLEWGRDIIRFHAGDTPGDWGRLGKQLCPFWDDRFINDEYLFISDADMLLTKNPKGHSIIEGSLKKKPTELQYFTQIDIEGNKYINEYLPILGKECCLNARNMFANTELKHDFEQPILKTLGKTVVDHCLTVYANITNTPKISLDDFLLSDSFLSPYAALTIYPAKHFHQERQNWIEFMEKCKLVGNDQALGAFVNKLFGYNNQPSWMTIDYVKNKENGTFSDNDEMEKVLFQDNLVFYTFIHRGGWQTRELDKHKEMKELIFKAIGVED